MPVVFTQNYTIYNIYSYTWKKLIICNTFYEVIIIIIITIIIIIIIIIIMYYGRKHAISRFLYIIITIIIIVRSYFSDSVQGAYIPNFVSEVELILHP